MQINNVQASLVNLLATGYRRMVIIDRIWILVFVGRCFTSDGVLLSCSQSTTQGDEVVRKTN